MLETFEPEDVRFQGNRKSYLAFRIIFFFVLSVIFLVFTGGFNSSVCATFVERLATFDCYIEMRNNVYFSNFDIEI